jgi:hypothetical protein
MPVRSAEREQIALQQHQRQPQQVALPYADDPEHHEADDGMVM